MKFAWLFGRLRRRGPAHTRRVAPVLSESEFLRSLRKERALSARTRRTFALLVLDPGTLERERREDLDVLLVRRMRDSDTIGIVEGGRYGIILPETDAERATLVADQLRRHAEGAGLACEVEIFVHPDPRAHEGSGPAFQERTAQPERREERDRSAALREPSEARFIGPVPAPEPQWIRVTRATGTGPVAIERVLIQERAAGDPVAASLAVLAPKAGTMRSVPAAQARPAPRAVALRDGRPPAEPSAEVLAGAPAPSLAPAPAQSPAGPALAEPSPVLALDEFFRRPMTPARRLVDVAVASALLVLLSPLFLAVALAIKLTSRGPVFFVKSRAGIGGRPFPFVKFRSMRRNADGEKECLADANEQDGPVFKIRRDPRITRVGRVLRRWSIDELPQLFNVLRGEMTLVGPRPPTLDEVAKYEPWQRERLSVPGGLTCIWQVSGRSDVGFKEWVRMDIDYIRRRSVLFDVALLARTVRAVVTGRGAY